jgi:hypothetical protein
MSSTSRYWAFRKEFEQRFGDAGKKVFDLWFDRIIEPLHWGYWRHDKFGEGQRHWNTDLDFDRGWAKKLTKTRLYQHFLARKKEESVFYTSTVFNVVGDHRVVFPMFDIDDKERSGQAQIVLDRLKTALPVVTFYSCPSTSGWGIHAFACLGFPKLWTRKLIVESLRTLSKWVRTTVNVEGNDATFDRVTGTPFYRDGSENLVRGVLGRVPSVQSETECEALYSALSSMTLWSELALEKSLCPEEKAGAGCRELGGEASVSTEAGGCEQGWMSGDTKQLAGSRTCSSLSPPLLTLQASDIADLQSDHCTLRRRRLFAMRLCRMSGRPLDSETLITAYEDSGLATGPRTPARAANFRQIAKYIASTFDTTKLRQGFESHLELARRMVESAISESDVEKSFGRQKNRSLLSRNDVAVVFAMYLSISARKKTVAISRKAAHRFSGKLKESGVIERIIDHKRFAASKRLLEKHGLIKLEGKARKGVMAARYSVNRPTAL